MRNSAMRSPSPNFEGIEYYGVELPSKKAVYTILALVFPVVAVALAISFFNQMLGGVSKL